MNCGNLKYSFDLSGAATVELYMKLGISPCVVVCTPKIANVVLVNYVLQSLRDGMYVCIAACLLLRESQ